MSNINNDKWNKYYEDIKTYYKHHHNLDIKDTNRHYKWLKEQENNYINNRLSKDKIDKLKKIKFNFKKLDKEKNWNNNYKIIEYYINNCHTEPKYNSWWNLNKKKSLNNKLPKEKIILINKLIDKYDSFNNNYNILKKYYLFYGNYKDLTNDFKTLDGITYNDKGINLTNYINSIRTSYKKHKLSKEIISKLKSIHFPFNDITCNWDYMYDLASNYYFAHDDLNVDKNFQTFDGITLSNLGFDLGKWVRVQRQNYINNNLNEEKKSLLDELSLVINPKKNRIQNICLLKKYNIKDRILINNYPNKELKAKIKYLEEVLHEPLIVKNTINPFLYMGSESLKRSYNITKKDLINRYNTNKKELVNN